MLPFQALRMRTPATSAATVIAVQEFDTPTTASTIDVTSSDLGGQTPKAVLFIVTGGLGTGSTNNEIAGMAAMDGGRWWAWSGCYLNGTALNPLSSRGSTGTSATGQLFAMYDGVEMYGASATLISGGVRLTFSAPLFASSFRCIAVMFAGSALSAYVGSQNLGTSATNIDVNVVGFQPKAVLFGSPCDGMSNVTNSSFTLNMGVATQDGTQRGLGVRENIQTGAHDPRLMIDTTAAVTQITTTQSYEGTINTFDSQGFSINMSASSGSDVVGYLALGGSIQAKIIDLTSRTSTGSQAITGVGFQPTAAIAALTTLETVDTIAAASDIHDGWGLSAFTTSEAWAASFQHDSGASTTDAHSRVTGNAIHATTVGNTNLVAATLTSFDADGLTLNYSAVTGTAKKGFILALR